MRFDAGVFPNIPMADYLAIPAVSASDVWNILTRCPRAAWWESAFNGRRQREDDTAAQGVGTLAHALLLEGRIDGMVVVDPSRYPNVKGEGVATSLSSNKAVKEACEAIRAAGKRPVSQETADKVAAMVAAIRAFIDSLRATEPAIWAMFQPDGGESELTVVWDDPTGVKCRIRPDRISKDRTIIGDLKTTDRSANPNAWARTMAGAGYHVSSAFYRRGSKATFHVEPEYAWIVAEQQPPHLCSLVVLEPSGKALGDARCISGLQEWGRCQGSNQWPGYPARACHIELPAYLFAQADEEMPETIPYDPSKSLAGVL